MAQLAVIILTVFAIFLLIGRCTSLPYRRDAAFGAENCDKTVPHVVIINSTTGGIINCHECVKCPYAGHGRNIPCHGQNVTRSDLNIECVPCVSGANYSTGEMDRCQPCLPKKCKAGEMMVGKCEHDGDKRTCESCKLKWYYNDTQMTCLPCACENMTTEIKEICQGIGFNSTDICKKDRPKTTPNSPDSFQNDKREVWDTMYTIIVVCGIAFVTMVGCLCCIRMRSNELERENLQLSVLSKEWICQIFCFRKAGGPSSTVADRHAQNGNGTERTSFLRQYSCPVTQNEKYAVIDAPHAVAFTQNGDGEERVQLLYRDCKQQKLKFFDMNAETYRVILQKLKDNVEVGMGYISLAGLMDFSAKQVKNFETSDNPCKKMMECWSDLDVKQNNVLKLKGLVEKLKRDDIVELLQLELDKAKKDCVCSACNAV